MGQTLAAFTGRADLTSVEKSWLNIEVSIPLPPVKKIRSYIIDPWDIHIPLRAK